MKYIKNATTRTPEHQLVFDAMQPMEGLGRPDAQSYMRIMQAIVGEIDRLKLATQWPSASQNRSGPKLEDHHARASAPFILVNRALAEIGNRHLEGKFDRDYYLATLDAIQSDAYTRIGDARLNIQESRESNNRERSMDAAISAAARTPQSISPEHELVVVAMQPMEEMGGPDEHSYIAIMQAVLDQIERSKLAMLDEQWRPPKIEHRHAHDSMHFIEVNRALDQIYNRYIKGKFNRDDYIAILDAIKGDVETRIDNVRHNMQEASFIQSEERRMDEASDASHPEPR
jgi:hypothetical protein